MAGKMIRGQETFISLFRDGNLVDKIDSIQDSEWTHNLEVQEEEFLGETSPRFDMIFKGTSFKLSGKLTNRAYFDFVESIVAKAQRRVGGAVRIDITSTFVFDGEVYTILFKDCAFESLPVTTGSRTDFTSWTLSGSCSKGTEVK